jgi:putative ABC transport system permease protein
MFSIIAISVAEAFKTLRNNILHTLLSTLGILIGVGALVSILALGDGMERFGREQIKSSTDLDRMMVLTKTSTEVDGVRIKRDSFQVIGLKQLDSLNALFAQRGTVVMTYDFRDFVSLDTAKRGAYCVAATPGFIESKNIVQYGRAITQEDINRRDSVVVINHTLATRLKSHLPPDQLIGQHIRIKNMQLRVVGVLEQKAEENPALVYPISLQNEADFKEEPPMLMVSAHKAEELLQMKADMEAWLNRNFSNVKENFEVFTRESYLKELGKIIGVFKAVMGLIVGISIIVGGIGIMNVLLMSVTERTREIGIRKAIGAKRKFIALQFLAEALVISLLGTLMGTLLGLLICAIASPIISSQINAKFTAMIGTSSALTITLVAIIIGIIFGVFPAMKAARLSPIEAMRHEN